MPEETEYLFHYKACEEFQKFPWHTQLLETDLDAVDAGRDSGVNIWESTDSRIQPFARLITCIAENNVLKKDVADHMLIIQNLRLQQPVGAVDYSTPQREYLFALFLFRYRVLDVGLWSLSKSASPPSLAGSITRTHLPDTDAIVRFKQIRDWQDLVQSAQAVCHTPPAPVSVGPEDTFKSACLKHVGLYIRRTEIQAQDAIFINFDTAALYLSHLLEGFRDLNRSNAPRALLEQLDKEPVVHIRRIRSPLHLALAVSPLVLLIPTNHVNSSCGRPCMLEIWKALGSERPPCIRMAERELWRAIFDLSLSADMDTRSRLLLALDNIVSELRNYPPERSDIYYFYPDPPREPSSSNAAPKTIKIIQPRRRDLEEEEEEEDEEEGDKQEEDGDAEEEQSARKENGGPGQDNERGSGMAAADPSPGDDEIDIDPMPDDRMEVTADGEGVMRTGGPGDGMGTDTSGEGVVGTGGNSSAAAKEKENEVVNTANRKEKVTVPPERQSARIASKPPVSTSLNPLPPRRPTKPQKSLSSRKPTAPRRLLGIKKVIEIVDMVLDEKPHPAITLESYETHLACALSLRVTAPTSSRLYGINGEKDFMQYTPSFHHQEHLDWFQNVILAVERSYIGGYPQHIADPTNSIIKIVDYHDFENLSTEAMQGIFAKKHIVVKNYPCRPAEFDEKAFSTLCRSSKPITIHDMSILPESTSGDERHVIGVTGDLLRSHRSPNGKIFNALDFPMPMRGPCPPETLAKDVVAYQNTLDDPYCKRETEYPHSHMYWALAATSHSFHCFHLDADGNGTFVAPQTGSKYWVLVSPKAGISLSATNIYLNGKYAIDKMNEDLWDVEAVLLTPGTCLFMKPNTPHLVITTEACIAHGGHFHPSSTLRATCSGLFHTFIALSLLTNTEHTDPSRMLLRRILFFFFAAFRTDYVVDGPSGKTISPKYRGEIPDVFTFEGLLDVLSLCNLMELANITHYKTYTPNGICPTERWRMIAGRTCARQVRHWLAAYVEIHHPHETPSLRDLDQDVSYPYLASQAAALVHYKKQAPISEAQGVVDFTLEDLVIQINSAFSDDHQFLACYKPSVDPETFDWVGLTYNVQPVEGSVQWKVLKDDGQNAEDDNWVKCQEHIAIIGGPQRVDGGDDSDTGVEEMTIPHKCARNK